LGLDMTPRNHTRPRRVHYRSSETNACLVYKYVVAGRRHTLALARTTDNPKLNVYGFGYNSDGQLGLGDCTRRNLPTRIDAFCNRSIALDRGHAMIYGLFPDLFMGISPKWHIYAGDTTSFAITTTISDTVSTTKSPAPNKKKWNWEGF